MRLPVSRARYNALAAQYERVIAERDTARTERDQARHATSTTARRFEDADAANIRLEGRNRALQQRLDDALGLNTLAVEDGKNWQTRRTDKPTTKEPTP
jgi:hypothetical protein